MNDELLNISLKQGKTFNIYQSKIKNNHKLSKKEGFVSSLDQDQIVGSNFINKSNNQVNTQNLDEITQLQTKYNDLIQKYTDIKQKIETSSLDTINRSSTNNPYLGKNILFTDGTVAYVTNQGIARQYTSEDILNNVSGKNGCPSKDNIVRINLAWSSAYIKGSTIPTNPPLIVGPNMKIGDICGHEGSNVYASKLVNNPSSTYIGCYNDKPPLENINVVPVMNSSNKTNGFVSSASSMYLGNNTYGPWSAFDQNPNTFWHSEIKYNKKNGVYEGSNGLNVANIGKISGEFLQINMPISKTSSASVQNIIVTQYSLSPRLDLIGTRSPNSWYILGYKDNQWVQIDRQQSQKFTSGTPKVYNIFNPSSYNSYALLVDKVGNDEKQINRNSVQVSEWNLFANTNSNFIDENRAMILNSNNTNYTSFENCQDYALNNGYTYFGLQNIQENGTAQCLVSNDIARTKIYGDASSQSNTIPIWSSNTATGHPNMFQLTSSGQITIFDINHKAIVKINKTVKNCEKGGTSYVTTATYGGNCHAPIGNVTDVVRNTLKCNNVSSCSIPISNDIFEDQDPSSNCMKAFSLKYTCGKKTYVKHMENAEGQTMILDCDQHMKKYCVFFLILQDDGNLCIYKGNDPTNNKGSVWCSKTTGKQKIPNPDWVSSKGKFGRNYLKSGESLSSNEWIGSTDGSLKLIMQSDGNLVLYTSEPKSACKVINNKTYGENWINAVYQLSETGNKSTLGKIGYIDSDSNLREYPDSMISFTNNYQIYQNTDSTGNDITNLVTTDQTGCETACNNNPDCSAYVYQGSSQTCWLKNKSAYPRGEKQYNSNVILGVRQNGFNKSAKGSNTCSDKIINIDTVQYDGYVKGDNMTIDTQCNASMISQKDKIAFDNIKTQLITLGNDIVSKMENAYSQDNKILERLNTNEVQFKKDLESYKLTNLKINNLQSNNIEGMQNLNNDDLNGILTETDLRVLQENYGYIAWSILAVGLLAITINMMKKS